MTTNTIPHNTAEIISEAEELLSANEPRILSITEQVQLQKLLWQLRDGAENARLCRGLAVCIGAVLNLSEEAFLLAREDHGATSAA